MNKQQKFIKQFLDTFEASYDKNLSKSRKNKIVKHLHNKDLMEMFFKFNGPLLEFHVNMYNHLEKIANKREKILLSLKGLDKLPRNMQRQIFKNI